MHTTSVPARRSANEARLLRELEVDERIARGLRELAEHAATLGLGDEVERLNRNADELDGAAEETRERLIAIGYDPAEAE